MKLLGCRVRLGQPSEGPVTKSAGPFACSRIDGGVSSRMGLASVKYLATSRHLTFSGQHSETLTSVAPAVQGAPQLSTAGDFIALVPNWRRLTFRDLPTSNR
jgi:hypothetical protein